MIAAMLVVSMVCGCAGVPRADSDDTWRKPIFLTPGQLRECQRFFVLLQQVQAEYASLLSTAQFPNEQAKLSARRWFKQKELEWKLLQLTYLSLQHYKTVGGAQDLLFRAQFFVTVPLHIFEEPGKKYANLARLENVFDEYIVTALRLGEQLSMSFAEPPRTEGK